MKRLFLLPLLLAGLATMLPAQQFTRIAFEQYTLANGLTVILHVDRTAPTAMTTMLYRVGSKDEVPGRTGFAHFFEHLMFEGTAHIPRGRIDKIITGAGGDLNAGTSNDKTEFFIKVPIHQLQLAIWIESERMRALSIDSAGIETQRNVVKEELKERYEGKPYATFSEKLFQTVFRGSQYEWTPIGRPEDINRATRQEFLDFHQQYYVPANACLVVGGDLDIAQTKRWIEAYFGSIPGGTAPQRTAVSLPPQTVGRSLVMEEETTPLPAVIEAYATVGQRHPDAYALELLGSILSDGRSSRLYKRLVDKEQLALYAGSFPFALEQSGVFAFFCIANQGVDPAAIKKDIAEEISLVQTAGVTEDEFQKARNAKETGFIQGLMSLDGRLSSLAWYALYFGNANLVNDEIQRYMAVTRADIQRVAGTYLTPERRNAIDYVVTGAK